MKNVDVKFVGSFPSERLCPQDGKPEFAFIGRSNVGKSSLINMLTGRKDIAKVSQNPGKTQTLNFYNVRDSWYIVDLPGYGYAKVSKKKRAVFERMIHNYLVKRPTLQCALVLIASNIPPQQKDIDFLNWLGEHRIPFVIVYTKTDKVKPRDLEGNIKKIQDKLLEYWNELPQQFLTSAKSRAGRAELLEFISAINARTEQ